MHINQAVVAVEELKCAFSYSSFLIDRSRPGQAHDRQQRTPVEIHVLKLSHSRPTTFVME